MSNRRQRVAIFAAVSLCSFSCPAAAEDPPNGQPARVLGVGVTHLPPGVIKGPDGSWSGLAVEAWKQVAEQLKLPYKFVESSLEDLNAPDRWDRQGIDFVPGYAVSKWSEERMDVTAPYITSGLAIAVRSEPTSGLAFLKKISSQTFLKALGVLALLLVVVGTVVWAIERKHSPDEFGGHPLRGIAAGAFWTIEALFGKSKSLSRTTASRIFALGWTVISVLMISGVTAKLASELTVNKMTSSVSGPNDLPKVKVGSLKHPSVPGNYLNRRGINFTPYDGAKAMVDGLARGEVDAIVGGAPQLRYRVAQEHAGRITILPGTFLNQGTGFAMKTGNPLRKRVNVALLNLIEGDEWPKIVARYLGSE